MDLLLSTSAAEEVAGIHARFAWLKGAGGFFLVADNKRGKEVVLNGALLRSNHRLIPRDNMIMIGECVFTLRYVDRDQSGEEKFQADLTEFYRQVHQELNPVVLPTPSNDQETLGEWIVQYPIARGSYGLVQMVIHSQMGDKRLRRGYSECRAMKRLISKSLRWRRSWF